MRVGVLANFPRYVGKPIRDGIVYDIKDFIKYVKKYGGKSEIHISVYSFSTIEDGKPVKDSAVIDEIYFDFDGLFWTIRLRKIHNYLMDKDILHSITCSGQGSNLDIYTKPTVRYKYNTVWNFQIYFCKKFHIKMDVQTRGDLMRMRRVPSTYNYRRGRYSNYLPDKLIQKADLCKIYDYCKKPRDNFEQCLFGNKLLDLSQWDKEDLIYDDGRTVVFGSVNLDELDISVDLPLDKFPPCVISWMGKKDLGFMGRYCLVLFLKNQDFTKRPLTPKEILSILKGCLDEDTWEHCSTARRVRGHREGENLLPIKKIFRTSYSLYKCRILKSLGLCSDRSCKNKHPIFG